MCRSASCSNESGPAQSPCIRCDTCDGFPCLVHAKSDAEVMRVRPGARTSQRIAHDRRLRLAPGDQRFGPRGHRFSSSAPAEQLSTTRPTSWSSSCGAINSAALLAALGQRQHPNGLANGSDVVGRHYMGHNNSVLLALSRCPNPTVFQKTLGINDFYFGTEDWPHPMGHISFVGKLDGSMRCAPAPPSLAPGWTLDIMAKHSLDFWLTSEDLPDPDNRVTLNRDGQIVLSYTPNNLEGHNRLQGILKQLMRKQNAGSTATSATTVSSRAASSSAIASRWPASPTRTAPFVLATIPRPPPWTPTAARTRSTTSTWSTAASSRRAPP